ncbi:MAG: hypothetical protein JO323_06845 [Acidobacteriia bacterium]|nr:hypothetical protein [Terriglobia bacterium]
MTQQQIDQAIRDQIGADPNAPLPSNLDIAQALANYAAEAAKVATALNQNEQTTYLTGFQNWANQVLTGKIPNTNPPQPPPAYLAATASDGWTYVIQGTDPVCSMPAIPTLPQAPSPSASMVVAIGAQIGNTNFWAALPANANVPAGYVTPGPVTTADGKVGFFTWVASPFGGWWQKIG